MTDTRDRKSRSLFGLVGDIPKLVKNLVKGEIDLLKAEMIAKAKVFGLAAGCSSGALVIVLLYAIGVLLTAAVMGLATVMPAWLAALLLAVVMLIVAGILGFVGWKRFKRACPSRRSARSTASRTTSTP